jgi:hypothetical protein
LLTITPDRHFFVSAFLRLCIGMSRPATHGALPNQTNHYLLVNIELPITRGVNGHNACFCFFISH